MTGKFYFSKLCTYTYSLYARTVILFLYWSALTVHLNCAAVYLKPKVGDYGQNWWSMLSRQLTRRFVRSVRAILLSVAPVRVGITDVVSCTQEFTVVACRLAVLFVGVVITVWKVVTSVLLGETRRAVTARRLTVFTDQSAAAAWNSWQQSPYFTCTATI